MARRATGRGTGRWVERAAATGGGRTYRGQAPVRWYASLVLICVLGVALVVYSRYEHQHPATTSTSARYAALAFDVCGNVQQNLAANPSSKTTPNVRTEGDGVIRVSSGASSNITLAEFVQDYRGLELTSSILKLPGKSALHSGSTCPAGTPDAHKRAVIEISMWSSFSGSGANHPVKSTDPSSVKISNGQLITVAFLPQGSSIPKPSGQTIVTLLDLVSGQSTSTSTTTATTTPTSTTAPSATTTSPSTTTTTKP